MTIWNILWNQLLFLLPCLFNYDLNLLIQPFHTVPEPRTRRLGDGASGNERALWSRSLALVNSCMVAMEWRLPFFISMVTAAVFASLQLLA